MADRLLSTSSAQVSGHRFLKRRVEHALVLGDARMIHDPLARRYRAALCGIFLTLLLGAGAGVMAFLRPAINPGEAPILRSDSGALFVRAGETMHPVANLATARLIAGSPANPVRISDSVLLRQELGPPLGIPDAPGVFAADDVGELSWVACGLPTGEVSVHARASVRGLGVKEAVLVAGEGAEWMITAEGRRLLPPAESAEGRAVRRALRISARTPRWQPPEALLSVTREHPPMVLPVGTLLHTEEGGWWLENDGKVRFLSGLQATILADAGWEQRDVERSYPAQQPDAEGPEPDLPSLAPIWVDPKEGPLCATNDAGLGRLSAEEEDGGVVLAGDSLAARYVGLREGAIAVRSGGGLHMVSEWGRVHRVADADAAAALGIVDDHASSAPWSVLRLLPQGGILGREHIPGLSPHPSLHGP